MGQGKGILCGYGYNRAPSIFPEAGVYYAAKIYEKYHGSRHVTVRSIIYSTLPPGLDVFLCGESQDIQKRKFLQVFCVQLWLVLYWYLWIVARKYPLYG